VDIFDIAARLAMADKIYFYVFGHNYILIAFL